MGGGYGGMGGMGMGMGGMGGMMGGMNPNDSNGQPGPPPSSWQRILHSISGVVSFAGKIAWLVDENSQALHFFMTALLQLLDRAGVLYGVGAVNN
jgi:peroxin-13